MKTWHYRRIKIFPCEPFIAVNGDLVQVRVDVRNSDTKSPFRRTIYALATLGM